LAEEKKIVVAQFAPSIRVSIGEEFNLPYGEILTGQVVAGLKEAKSRCGNGKPVVIVMTTEMGFPIDFMVGSHEWHGIAPNDAQLESALAQLEETLGDY